MHRLPGEMTPGIVRRTASGNEHEQPAPWRQARTWEHNCSLSVVLAKPSRLRQFNWRAGLEDHRRRRHYVVIHCWWVGGPAVQLSTDARQQRDGHVPRLTHVCVTCKWSWSVVQPADDNEDASAAKRLHVASPHAICLLPLFNCLCAVVISAVLCCSSSTFVVNARFTRSDTDCAFDCFVYTDNKHRPLCLIFWKYCLCYIINICKLPMLYSFAEGNNATRSHPVMVGDMSRVTLNFGLSKIPFVHF